MTKRKLVLEDGTTFVGDAFGSETCKFGEVVFFTGMTGYQEMMTDPSYAGKIVVMTYPTIGAYGLNRDDVEAIAPAINGMIVKEVSAIPSNFRSEETVHDYLIKHNIPGISGIDTRMLTRRLRRFGPMKGIIVDLAEEGTEKKYDTEKVSSTMELLEKASISKPYTVPGHGKRIVIIDYGIKQSILHEWTKRGCHITVVPYYFTKKDIMPFQPDGIVLSNGPGNPVQLPAIAEGVRTLLGHVPLFGIGLGHQLIALAYGASVEQLAIGHFGTNFPVKDLQKDKTWITTQSRAYNVNEDSLQQTGLTVTHRSLQDHTVEGLQQLEDAVSTIQFHPEGGPGTNETATLFDAFLQQLENQDGQSLKNGGSLHA